MSRDARDARAVGVTDETATLKDVFGSLAFWRWAGPVALGRMPPLMAAVAVTTAAAILLGDSKRGGTIASVRPRVAGYGTRGRYGRGPV